MNTTAQRAKDILLKNKISDTMAISIKIDDLFNNKKISTFLPFTLEQRGIEYVSSLYLKKSKSIFSGGKSANNNNEGTKGTATRYKDSVLSTLSDASSNGISTLGYTNFGSGLQRFLLIFPSSSAQAGKPADIFDGAPPAGSAVANRYYVYLKDIAIPGSEPGDVYYFTTENPVDGETNWGMVYLYSQSTANTRYYLMPDTQATP